MVTKPFLFRLLGSFLGVFVFLAHLVSASDTLRFEQDIVPILYHHCYACHSAKQPRPKGDLRLDSVEGILSSQVIVPDQPEDSELMRRISLPHSDDAAMPPRQGGAQPLSMAERDKLRQWIADGAKFGSWVRFEHRGQIAAALDSSLASADVRWLSNELQKKVDQFHVARGTQLNAPISDETFLRRVYLDVVGRIPSLEESSRFLDSTKVEKRGQLIDELLSSEGFVSHMFNWKADLLRINTRGLAPGQPGKLYDDWVKDAIRSRMPYDEFVRQLVTASGYLWQNGAVGFYIRDLGMPLDHMSNMTRIFLGTRIECAQCHDHPLEPITQKDFYQMVAFTYGVSNLGQPGGYSPTYVKQWPDIKAKLTALGSDKAFEDSVSGTIAPLKRLTRDTQMQLKYPESYPYEADLRGQPVEPRTLFGDEVDSENLEPRKAFAAWLTSPRNPRFAKNIANRLWQRVMGIGLIEPVDSLSALPDAEHAELLSFLTQAMVQLGFDERAFMAMLLNTRLYQSEAVRDTPEPGANCSLRGPQLRRLSAEQIWDSCLVLLVPDLDQRKSMFRLSGVLDPQRLRRLTEMTADEILQQAQLDRAEHARRREFNLLRAEQQRELTAAKARGDKAELQRLMTIHEKQTRDLLGDTVEPGDVTGAGEAPTKETDLRWKMLPPTFIRASETPLPLPLGHFLRQFGQSDRREIDAFNRDPNTTHALALMNGELTTRILRDDSFLRRSIEKRQVTGEPRIQSITRAILVRSATAVELTDLARLTQVSTSPEQDIIWAMINSPEFLFSN